MSETGIQTETKPLTLWQRYWRVMENPADGVVVAMPIGCRSKSFRVALDSREETVYYMGWAPDRGLVFSAKKWIPKKGKPNVPEAGWATSSEVPNWLHDPTSLKYKYEPWSETLVTDLPWPPGTPREAMVDRFEFKEDLLGEFFERCPAGVGTAFRSMTQGRRTCSYIATELLLQTEFTSRTFLRLHLLLGGDAPDGMSAQEASRRRVQFALSHGVFAVALVNPAKRSLIDKGEPSIPWLSQALKTTPAVTRALSGVDPYAISQAPMMLSAFGLTMLSVMDPSWLSAVKAASKEECLGMHTMLNSLEMALGPERGGSNKRLRSVLWARGMPPDPKTGYAWLADHRAWNHIHDTAQAMLIQLVQPALSRTSGNIDFTLVHVRLVNDIITSLGAQRAQRVINTHLGGLVHDARMGLRAGHGSPGQWPALSGDVTAPNGRRLRFLVTQDDLDKEGSEMAHCVATYGKRCARRFCAIMSVGDVMTTGRWRPSSTAEIVRRKDNESEANLAVAQHYGPGNDRAPGLDREAVAWWLSQARTDEVEWNREALLVTNEFARDEDRIDLENALGEGWRTPEAHAHRWDRWRRILGTRAPSFGDFLLALPNEFWSLEATHEEVVGQIVDMDEEMALEREIGLITETEDEPELSNSGLGM